MPSGDDEREHGVRDLARRGSVQAEERRHEVSLQVVHPGKGQLARPGVRRCETRPDQERSDQSRPAGYREQLDVAEPHLAVRLRKEARQRLEVVPGGQFRHDTEVGGVGRDLRRDQVDSDAAVALEYRYGGLVAGGLDPQGLHGAISRTVASFTGRATPRSDTIAVINCGGVTSNAGL